MNRFVEVTKPVSTHSHLREGEAQGGLVRHAEDAYSIALAITNTVAGVRNSGEKTDYEERAKRQRRRGKLRIIATIMGNEQTSIHDLILAAIEGRRLHIKYVPYKRTTNAQYGVRRYVDLFPQLEAAEENGHFTHWHPEHPNLLHGNREAEYMFLSIFEMIHQRFPRLKMVWEHCSDARVIPMLTNMGENVAIGVTPHHLMTNETAMFGKTASGVMRPPLKTEADRQGLLRLVTSGFPRVIFGPDDAPHDISKKSDPNLCTCGAWHTPYATLVCATAFDEAYPIDSDKGRVLFDDFMSSNACLFFGWSRPEEKIWIESGEYHIPDRYNVGGMEIVPFMAGESLPWRFSQAE